MGEYTIKKIEVLDDIIKTEVEYTFKGLSNKKTIIVSHFRPKSKQEILDNINKRQESEQYQMDNKDKIEQDKEDIKREAILIEAERKRIADEMIQADNIAKQAFKITNNELKSELLE